MNFLVRSRDHDAGYTELPLGASLPRSAAASYVPWAIVKGSGQVVYAKAGEHTSWFGGVDRAHGNRP